MIRRTRNGLMLALVSFAGILTIVAARFLIAGFGTGSEGEASWAVNISRNTVAPRQEGESPIANGTEPNSMQTFLLDSTEDNRAQVFRLAILDAGFVCPKVNTARLVGSDGASWRATCDAGNTYWVDVEETGRLKPTPVISADTNGIDSGSSGSPIAPVIPQPGTDRTLRLEFEQELENNR